MARKSDPQGREEVERSLEAYLQSVVTYPEPPEDFRPGKASARELLKYGYPRRPDRESEAHLLPLWEKAFARPHHRIRAEVEIDRVLLNRADRWARVVRDGRFAPSGWGGIVALTSDFSFSPPEPPTMVYGEMAVPAIAPDFDNPNTPMTVGFWVGIDGYGTNQVLQAGIAATVTGENVDYWTWFEWFPAPPVRIPNFPIERGDVVTVLVCAPSVGQGFASFLNRQTGATTSVGFLPPPGLTALGATAEWIVEGISADLPNFTLFGFHECVAGTKTHRIDLSHPTETEIAGVGGNLTVAAAWGGSHVLVVWEGFR